MENDQMVPFEGSYFRKLHSHTCNFHSHTRELNSQTDYAVRERQLIEHLMTQPTYHPNIVSFYHVTERYIDMELLEPLDPKDPLTDLVSVMSDVKKFLHSIGIMYMDWKIDNVVKSKRGYTLIDFDNSGIVEKGKWKVEPSGWSYREAKTLYEDPKDMDDWSFDYNLVKMI
jgi:serine/threonine protein kinase